MYIFQELDKWAMDIEKNFKEKYFASPRTRRQYMKICLIRDRLYDKYLKRVEKFNKIHSNVRANPTFKDCKERFREKLTSAVPSPPETRLIKDGSLPNNKINNKI